MKSNFVFFILISLLVVGVCCNGNVKIKVNGRMVLGDDFAIDSSSLKLSPKPKLVPGDTIKVGLVINCNNAKDKTLANYFDGNVWTGYMVKVKISSTATATKFLLYNKQPLPRGCYVEKVIKGAE